VNTLRGAGRVDERMMDRFRAEVLRSRQINHPNVARVYDLFIHRRDDGATILFFTMELLEGETLAEWLDRHGPFPSKTALSVLQQVAAALDAAHLTGIVHRDLKPANIFICREPQGVRATVTDFGIAAEAGSKVAAALQPANAPNASVVAGTPAYMAPEQLTGEPGSPASDVYSLGLVAYEMMTGKQVFPEKSPLACALRKLRSETPPVIETSGLPQGWAAAIQKCIRQEPALRFAMPTEFVAALYRRENRFVTRRRWFLISGAAACAAAAAAVLGKRWPPSLAVLPFENLSGDPDMAYFSDGVSEELTHAMTSYPTLFVAAQNAAFRFRDRSIPSSTISKTLGVDMLLTGSIRRTANRLRVNVQLVKGKSGRQVWSEIYDRDLQQVFVIQTEIIKEVAARLALSGAAPVRDTSPTNNTAAYDLYLQGRHFWNIRSNESLNQGLGCFTRAVQLDSSFALAWAGVADTYLILGEYGWVPPSLAAPKIREALDRSLAIDPGSAEALVSLGLYNNVYAWDQAGAERAFQHALTLKPSLYLAHSWYGNYLMRASRWDEALREAEIAAKLDPVSLPARVFLGWVRYYRREYDKAVDIAKQAVAMDQKFAHAHNLLALSYAGARKIPDALREVEQAAGLTSDPAVATRYRAIVLSQIPGFQQQARQAAEQLESLSNGRQSGYLAIAYAGIGDRERTYQYIERGLRLQDSSLHLTIISPQLDTFRNEREFKELVRQLGYLR
jgi:serine/threonine-protein kinase